MGNVTTNACIIVIGGPRLSRDMSKLRPRPYYAAVKATVVLDGDPVVFYGCVTVVLDLCYSSVIMAPITTFNP